MLQILPLSPKGSVTKPQSMMLSPNPFSLFCVVLLCLPLALVFTTAPTTTTTAVAGNVPIPRRVTVKRNYISRKTQFDPLEEITPPSITISQIPPKPPRSDEPNSSIIPPPTPPLPPELPPDDDKDRELFRRASRVNPNHSPPDAPRKIAFMFLTTTPLPFAPLWESFFNGSERRYYNIYIHADPTHEYDPPFSGQFSGRVIPYSKPTRRHSPTLASAARRLISHALLDDPANHIFTLLSASCIPLHSFDFTYKTLSPSKKSFIEILSNETGAYERWAARGDEAMLPVVPFEDFRIGSQFWSLTRRHARTVARDVRLWEKFKLPCVQPYTCYPEEHYFPTLMSTVGERGVVPATLTHVDWSVSGFDGHPRSYNTTEVGPELIQRLRSETPRYGEFGSNGSDVSGSGTGRNDPFLFARKFEPDCLGPLLNISDDVIFRD